MANPTGNQKNDNQNPLTPQKPKISRGIFSWMLICFVLIMLYGMINGSGGGQEITSWNDFLNRAKAGQFEDNRVTVEEARVVAIIADSTDTPGWLYRYSSWHLCVLPVRRTKPRVVPQAAQ